MTDLVLVACVGVVMLVACVGVVYARGAAYGRRILGFLGFLGVFGFLGMCGFLGVLGDLVVGVVVGGVVVVIAGFFLLLVVAVVVEVGERRAAQVPAHLRMVPALAPRTLRWVRGFLPSNEGAAWLAEVTSCLAETTDKGERRRYVRSYRRNVPRLIWTSWAEHLSASRQRELL